MRTLQTFVDILHSFRFIPFRFVFILFYFIIPKPNKRIKQNKSFSTFCIVPPFGRLFAVCIVFGIRMASFRGLSLLTERERLGMVSLYECLSMGGHTSLHPSPFLANGFPVEPAKLFAAKLLTKYLFAYFKSHFCECQQQEWREGSERRR